MHLINHATAHPNSPKSPSIPIQTFCAYLGGVGLIGVRAGQRAGSFFRRAEEASCVALRQRCPIAFLALLTEKLVKLFNFFFRGVRFTGAAFSRDIPYSFLNLRCRGIHIIHSTEAVARLKLYDE